MHISQCRVFPTLLLPFLCPTTIHDSKSNARECPTEWLSVFGPDSTTSQFQLYSHIQIHLLGLPNYPLVISRQMDVIPLLHDDGVQHKQQLAGPRT
jgi:hypothetical protein